VSLDLPKEASSIYGRLCEAGRAVAHFSQDASTVENGVRIAETVLEYFAAICQFGEALNPQRVDVFNAIWSCSYGLPAIQDLFSTQRSGTILSGTEAPPFIALAVAYDRAHRTTYSFEIIDLIRRLGKTIVKGAGNNAKEIAIASQFPAKLEQFVKDSGLVRPTGIDIPDVQLPAGDHMVRVDIKDSDGRVGSTSFVLKVAP